MFDVHPPPLAHFDKVSASPEGENLLYSNFLEIPGATNLDFTFRELNVPLQGRKG